MSTAAYLYATPESDIVPQTGDIAAGAAISGPFVPGATVTRAGDTIPELAAKLYRRSDLHTSVADLTGYSLGKKFYEQLNEVGSGEVTIPNDAPALALLGTDDFIRFEVDGFAAHTILVNDILRHSVAGGEEVDENTVLSGPGHLSVLSEAVVYPSNGLDGIPIQEDRHWNWTSLDYDDTWWTMSHGFVTYGQQPSYYRPGSGLQDFPDDAAYWMWAPGSNDSWAWPGPCYFRKWFYVAPEYTMLSFHAAFDDYATVYLDGNSLGEMEFGDNPMMTHDPTDQMNLYEFPLDIRPGWHLFAIKCANGIDPEGDYTLNPGGVLLSVYGLVGENEYEFGPIVRSDSSWKCLPYPPTEPGMTAGEVIIHCLNEAQARGALVGVRPAFDRYVDCEGVPWPIVADISTKVGTDVLTFLRELSATYIDFWMEPSSFTLCAWVRDGRGHDTDVTFHTPTDFTDPDSGNLVTLDHHRTLGVTDALLVRWFEGWREVVRPSGIRREALLGLGAQESVTEIDRLGNSQLDVYADPRTAITAEVAPADDAERPYRAYGVGDTVVVPDIAGTPIRERVLALTVSEDDDGNVTYAPELGDIILVEQERFAQALKKMENGTMQGDSKIATPVAYIRPKAAPTPPNAFQPEIVFSLSGSVTTSASPPWVRRSDGELLEIVALLGNPGSGPTSVAVRLNGATIHTITIPAGVTSTVAGGLDIYVRKDVDVLTDQVTAAGPGAVDLTVLHRFRF